jgi:hypothetical protein
MLFNGHDECDQCLVELGQVLLIEHAVEADAQHGQLEDLLALALFDTLQGCHDAAEGLDEGADLLLGVEHGFEVQPVLEIATGLGLCELSQGAAVALLEESLE